jgi:hypothetical protein
VEGIAEGGTGNTEVLVLSPRERNERIAGEGDAAFRATIDIDEPRRISITAEGPLAQRQAAVKASVTQWVLPGKQPHGPDGVILELPGFAGDIVEPAVYGWGKRLGDTVPIRANLVLMCGCSVHPGGIWNSDRYELSYTLAHNGQQIATGPLAYAGTPSRFETSFKAAQRGVYRISVTAYDPLTGNSGADQTTVVIQ